MNINRYDKVLLYCIPIVLCLITFHWIRMIGFAGMDDGWMLLEDKLIPMGFTNKVFLNINNLQYSPLNTLYYILIYKIDGFNPYWYHLGSLLIHLFNGYLVYKLLTKIFEVFEVRPLEKEEYQVVPYIIMLTWLIHPFNVESVVWISASKIPLYTLFFLLSFYYFILAFTKKQHIVVYYGLSIIFFICSFLSKEQALVLPMVIGVFIIIYCIKEQQKIRFSHVIWLLPYLILSLIFAAITLYCLHYEGAEHPFDKFPIEKRLFFTFYSLGFYIFNSPLPIDLHYHYPFPIKPTEDVPILIIVISVMLVVSLCFLLHTLRKDKNYLTYIFFFLFFLINIVLCLHILPLPRASIVADRYMYLSLLGTLSAIYIYFFDWTKLKIKERSTQKVVFISASCLVIIGFMVYSNALVQDWLSR